MIVAVLPTMRVEPEEEQGSSWPDFTTRILCAVIAILVGAVWV